MKGLGSLLSGEVEVIGKNILDAKLIAAAPHILAHNRGLITEMLDVIKPTVIAQTPLGPGHFGYHLRDKFVTEVKSEGVTSEGVLKSPMTGYWREYGTRGNYRKGGPATAGMARAAREGFFGHSGERPFMTAHHALAAVRKLIKVFYGGQAAWWRL